MRPGDSFDCYVFKALMKVTSLLCLVTSVYRFSYHHSIGVSPGASLFGLS